MEITTLLCIPVLAFVLVLLSTKIQLPISMQITVNTAVTESGRSRANCECAGCARIYC